MNTVLSMPCEWQAAAWAVFGAARRWFQTPDRIPAEEIATKIETMVSPVLFGALNS